ncbi:hypothetical protein A4H97_29095 [Niastella yeongjuensis]|uniref:Uncharacterized protein n=1 Tax=Niastella yeongjuensis TaxID=354355 RepID=A0A1V9ESQ2_9BACT|nr:hypothetical protein [Niastella yeongjuensis]OQP48944.1 hypothetical protein A4H97_29095 [Niastella yeongjuensis]SEP08546.1 hypothetical protein SAMN05660816_04316 [Niastella yeongjuensis]
MFLPGQIIYFPDFFFKNGNTAKPKYFIVLAKNENDIIVGALPTRSNNVPSFVTVPHGCINIDERCYNCYVFEKDKVVGKKGFKFYEPTFIYGHQIEDYKIAIFEQVYPIEGVDYHILDLLTDAEFTSLKNCLLNSTSVKNKIKNYLR